MRQAIKEQLIGEIPEIAGRCYEPHEVTASTVKPYLVVRQGVEKETNSWSGFQRVFEIWPYADITDTFVTVDRLAEKVNAALEKQMLETQEQQSFSCFSLGTAGADQVDNTSSLLTRGLLFGVIGVRPVVTTESETPDPWLDLVADWTSALLGTTWKIYRTNWPLGYQRPAVLWRIANIEAKNQNPSTYLVRKILIGHVLGSAPNQQNAGVLRVLQQLRHDTKLLLDEATHQYLTVEEVSGDYQVDPLNKGQITVIVSKLAVRTAEEAPLISAVHDTGVIS
ncbi:MAG TPA: hypothetical protein VHY08_15745 [Bacillota bacterium]|nr:hypothetical protein [Bacillota bacterium]